MLSLKNLRLAYGSKILFDEANLQLYIGQKIGLVGQNGSGKTSLFKLILGQNHPDIGDFGLSQDTHIAYVEQEIEDSDILLTEYVLNVHPLIIEAHIDLPEYYQLRPSAEKLLINLGFSQEELYLPLNHFSGGWQMRANLAKALFVPSDLLLLDEPTNHLDVETVIWLEDWLKKYSGLLMIISHDREFLDNVTNHTLSLSNKRLTLYTGNYSIFERTRAEQLIQHQQVQAKNLARVAHLQKFVDKFSAGTRAKQAQSRVKMIEKIQIAKNIPKDIEYDIEFLEPEYQVDKLISISDATIGYPGKTLINHAKLDIFQNSRIGLLGRNGIGKSTLIKTFIDGSTLQSGIREINPKVKIGYFAQHTVDGISLTDSPLSLFSREHKNKREQELRGYLGSYGFVGDKVHESIKNFSGGEKARLTIANIILHRPNIIFLDEPTNHLDMQMREELASSIQDFNGAVVIVSHDKFLLSSVVDEFYLIDGGHLKPFNGDLEEYHQFLLKKDTAIATKNKVPTIAPTTPKPAAQKNVLRLKSDLANLEEKILRLETQIKTLEEQMAEHATNSDNAKLKETTDKYNQAKAKLDEIESKWLEIHHAIGE
ncbi:MAG: transporter ATP-binding protein [Burkholderiales bacterium]|jgi:ATP-binding cassette subfamily F protein 3|nr:transporter ATP-binding protein [Burkholderiales bacterium]